MELGRAPGRSADAGVPASPLLGRGGGEMRGFLAERKEEAVGIFYRGRESERKEGFRESGRRGIGSLPWKATVPEMEGAGG